MEEFLISALHASLFIFFIGVITIALLILIRIDVDMKMQIGERANIIERTTPILEDPVLTAISGVITNKQQESNYHPNRIAARKLQRDPRLLLSSLFGSLYGRTDNVKV